METKERLCCPSFFIASTLSTKMQTVAWNMSMKARRAVTNLTATSIWKSTCWNAQQGESSDVRAVTNITATSIWKSTCGNVQQRDARVETVPAIFNMTNLPSRLSFSRFESSRAERLEEHGFESTTISDILKQKGDKADGHWLFCNTEDSVYDAVKSVIIGRKAKPEVKKWHHSFFIVVSWVLCG
jgi:hypothetical protein